MKPEPHTSDACVDLFRNRLDKQLNQRHPLFKLAHIVNWQVSDKAFGKLHCPDNGSPDKSIRLMAGLQYLKHLQGLSDEQTVGQWAENPYWKYFCGEDCFQHDPPMDTSSMSGFSNRIGESGCELILQATDWGGNEGGEDQGFPSRDGGYNDAIEGGEFSNGWQVAESFARTADRNAMFNSAHTFNVDSRDNSG